MLGKKLKQIKYTKFKRNETCSILRFHRVIYDTSLEACNTQSHEKYLRNDNHEVSVFLSVAETIDLWCWYCSVTF